MHGFTKKSEFSVRAVCLKEGRPIAPERFYHVYLGRTVPQISSEGRRETPGAVYRGEQVLGRSGLGPGEVGHIELHVSVAAVKASGDGENPKTNYNGNITASKSQQI